MRTLNEGGRAFFNQLGIKRKREREEGKETKKEKEETGEGEEEQDEEGKGSKRRRSTRISEMKMMEEEEEEWEEKQEETEEGEEGEEEDETEEEEEEEDEIEEEEEQEEDNICCEVCGSPDPGADGAPTMLLCDGTRHHLCITQCFLLLYFPYVFIRVYTCVWAHLCVYTGCNRGFHMHCMVPEMKEIPRGLFLCSQCENVRSRTEDMKLSEYEKQRLRNIERNAKVLAGIMASAQVDTRTHTGI